MSMSNDHVLGIIEDPRTDTLATDLRSAGFSEFSLANAAEEGDNTVARIIEQIKSQSSSDAQVAELYENQARSGNPIVAVKVQDETEAPHAIDVLERNHVAHIHRFAN